MNIREAWERVYASKSPDRLGWYAPHLRTSLECIDELRLPPNAPIIDVGAGASTLVDDLLDAGYTAVTILDVSARALSVVRERLGARSRLVTLIAADITAAELPARRYRLWHDRAVFHFLVDSEDRQAYRRNLSRALQPHGHLLIATFAPEAPPECSGLPVRRYSRARLVDEFGAEFELLGHRKQLHVTPGGIEQMYLFCHFRKLAEAGA